MELPIFKYSIHNGRRYNFISGSPVFEQLNETIGNYQIDTVNEHIDEIKQVLNGDIP